MIQMNLFIKQKQTHRLWPKTCYQRKHVEGGMDWGLGMAYALYCTWTEWSTRNCCMAQGTLPNIMWWSIWEKILKKNGCVYLYNWITLLYSRNCHNIVNQLYFSKTLKNAASLEKWYCSSVQKQSLGLFKKTPYFKGKTLLP